MTQRKALLHLWKHTYDTFLPRIELMFHVLISQSTSREYSPLANASLAGSAWSTVLSHLGVSFDYGSHVTKIVSQFRGYYT